MRIASSPTLRIASGLLLAVLLSVVGYQVARWLHSHGPEALLKRADGVSWLVSSVQAQSTYSPAGQELIRPHRRSMAPHIAMGQTHARVDVSNSIPSAILDSIVVNLRPDLVVRMSVLSRRQATSA